MALKNALQVLVAAYGGGLLASFLFLAFTATDLELIALIFASMANAVLTLFWTIPGTILVLQLFRRFRRYVPEHPSYGLAVIAGAAIGGLMLWVVFPFGPTTIALGALNGLTTALVWAAINKWLIKIF